MPNFGENTRNFLEFPIYYYDVVYSQSLPVRGYAGCASVLVNAWDPIAVAPALLNVDASGNLKITGSISATTSATATAAAPTYVEGTSNALSMDLAGNLRTSGASTGLTDAQLRATPVPVSGTFYQTTQPVSLVTLPNPSNIDVPLSMLAASQIVENLLQAQQLAVMRAGPNGFVPMETPSFLSGFGY